MWLLVNVKHAVTLDMEQCYGHNLLNFQIMDISLSSCKSVASGLQKKKKNRMDDLEATGAGPPIKQDCVFITHKNVRHLWTD